MKRYYLPLGIFLAMVALFGVGLTLDPSIVPSPLIGKPAPAFRGRALGVPDRIITEATLKGRVSALNVFASWCTACLDEHPNITKLSRQIPVYGLNYKDRESDAKRWLSRYGDPYTEVIVDRDGAIGLDWGVYGVPETFIVDADGIIRHKHIGAITAEALNEIVLPLIRRLRKDA